MERELPAITASVEVARAEAAAVLVAGASPASTPGALFPEPIQVQQIIDVEEKDA